MSTNKREFTYKPYLKQHILLAFENLLLDIQDTIMEGLKDYSNFLGVQFIDVSAGGIQIRGFHKDIVGYSYGSQVTIKYDMSNAYECAELFIEKWKESDTEANLKEFKRFIKFGEEYGWD